jgi:hypothetical protein
MNYIKTNTCFPISINNDLNGNIFPHIFEKPKNNQNTISACQINVKFNDTQSKNIANSWFNTSIKMSNTANKHIQIKHKELKNLFLRINDLKYQIKRHITEKYKLGHPKQLLEKTQINKIKNREIHEYNKILQNKITFFNDKIKNYDNKIKLLYDSEKYLLKKQRIIDTYEDISFLIEDLVKLNDNPIFIEFINKIKNIFLDEKTTYIEKFSNNNINPLIDNSTNLDIEKVNIFNDNNVTEKINEIKKLNNFICKLKDTHYFEKRTSEIDKKKNNITGINNQINKLKKLKLDEHKKLKIYSNDENKNIILEKLDNINVKINILTDFVKELKKYIETLYKESCFVVTHIHERRNLRNIRDEIQNKSIIDNKENTKIRTHILDEIIKESCSINNKLINDVKENTVRKYKIKRKTQNSDTKILHLEKEFFRENSIFGKLLNVDMTFNGDKFDYTKIHSEFKKTCIYPDGI